MAKYANDLRTMGLECTSQWLQEKHASNTTLSEQIADLHESGMREIATMDLDDVKRSDVIVFFSQSDQTPTFRGGRHVEFGYALARNKIIVVVGPKENIFHYLPQVKHFKTWSKALTCLESTNEFWEL